MTLVFSVLLLLPAVIGANYISENTLWIVSAFVPILGLLAVAESTRSTIYGMSEFEISTRFSLKSVVLARMSVLGVLDFIAGMLVQPPAEYRIWGQLWDYLPTCFLSMWNTFDFRLVSLFGTHFTSYQIVPSIYIVAATLLAWLGSRIYCHRQISGR